MPIGRSERIGAGRRGDRLTQARSRAPAYPASPSERIPAGLEGRICPPINVPAGVCYTPGTMARFNFPQADYDAFDREMADFRAKSQTEIGHSSGCDPPQQAPKQNRAQHLLLANPRPILPPLNERSDLWQRPVGVRCRLEWRASTKSSSRRPRHWTDGQGASDLGARSGTPPNGSRPR
jgi:hypothetical protein